MKPLYISTFKHNTHFSKSSKSKNTCGSIRGCYSPWRPFLLEKAQKTTFILVAIVIYSWREKNICYRLCADIFVMLMWSEITKRHLSRWRHVISISNRNLILGEPLSNNINNKSLYLCWPIIDSLVKTGKWRRGAKRWIRCHNYDTFWEGWGEKVKWHLVSTLK